MNTISITSNNLLLIFEQIQAQLGGELTAKSKEYRLEINNDIAEGFVSGISVEPAISYIEYNIFFKDDVTLTYRHDNSNSIHFGYCSKGSLIQSFGEHGTKNKLSQFQTGIFSNSAKKRTFMFFKKGEEVKISLILVDVLTVLDSDLKIHLQDTFLNSQKNNELTYIGSFNLKIVEKIEHLNNISQKGLIRNLLINSTVYLILALELEQHKDDLSNAENNSTSLSQSEMEALKDISEFIRNYPEIQYSLKYLSIKSGLSPIKLQEGFKIMHNRTVTDFIRNVRVETAENLIRTSELNISEIVYTIGLTSRSYFSKIFKAKYNCSPKHYQNQQNRLAITA
ncbi:AraC family transcriptional regulator [Pseudalgibacter alginicilyticus]|uniref:AraC family transcriptional regulator n=1 Tax=Pseudalgibacter alginicilyticus TaxID=1736674 RepID=A0A0P0CTR1_9FLAO|nr:AraC family transcriptional regulator [Pseudalgibacter alginicilyticus]ALJ03699.1 AraC family transcriptional regulator [Pseudalgibacter alginicilyticus]